MSSTRPITLKQLAARAGVPEWADLYYALRFSMRDPLPKERNELDRIRRLL